MKLLMLTATVLLSLTPACFGETLDGYLMPSKCRDDDPKAHTKECAMRCRSTGFGIVTAAGEYVVFNTAGNAQAQKLLERTGKTADLRISVQGTRHGDLLDVESIGWK